MVRVGYPLYSYMLMNVLRFARERDNGGFLILIRVRDSVNEDFYPIVLLYHLPQGIRLFA